MSSRPAVYALFVGIDIAATSFTTILSSDTPPSAERPFTLDQTPHGYAALQERLAATDISPADTLVVLEATSTY